jgi:hypothetical protein
MVSRPLRVRLAFGAVALAVGGGGALFTDLSDTVLIVAVLLIGVVAPRVLLAFLDD